MSSKLQLHSILGEGDEKIAYEATLQDTDFSKPVVAIQKRPERALASPTAALNAQHLADTDEVRVSASLDHINLASVFQKHTHNDTEFMLYEGTTGKTLEHHINQGVSSSTFRRLREQLFSGLSYLHSQDLLHHDIKPENILVFDSSVLKIADFGSTGKQRPPTPYFLRGSSARSAPSTLNKWFSGERGTYTARDEVFATASTLFSMLSGAEPFNYSVRHDKDGTELVSGLTASLYVDDVAVDEITPGMHRQQWRKAKKAIPLEYRGVLGRALSFEPEYETIEEFSNSFALPDAANDARRTARRYAAIASILGGVAASFLIGTAWSNTEIQADSVQLDPAREAILEAAQRYNITDYDLLEAATLPRIQRLGEDHEWAGMHSQGIRSILQPRYKSHTGYAMAFVEGSVDAQVTIAASHVAQSLNKGMKPIEILENVYSADFCPEDFCDSLRVEAIDSYSAK